MRQRRKPRTQDAYRRTLDGFIIPAFGAFKVADVARSDIAVLHNKHGAIPYQLNQMLNILSKMFNLAKVWGFRPDGSNRCRHVPKYPERNRERYLSTTELQQLGHTLDAVEADGTETPFIVAAFRLLLLTGCRLREIQTLKWQYITPCGMELPDSKPGARRIPLPQAARDVLAALPRAADNPYVIASKLAGRRATDLEHPWQRIRQRAELPGVRTRDLRDTYALNAVSSGMPIQMVGRLLGYA